MLGRRAKWTWEEESWVRELMRRTYEEVVETFCTNYGDEARKVIAVQKDIPGPGQTGVQVSLEVQERTRRAQLCALIPHLRILTH
jgi:dihydroneopterin aldolase